MEEKKLTGYPSIDRPWLKYYSEEAINAPLPECSMYEYLWNGNKMNLTDTAIEFVDNGHEFVIYCQGLHNDKTPDLSISRLVDGNLEEIEENDWKRIRTLMRYLLYDKEPLRAVRYGTDGVEILS